MGLRFGVHAFQMLSGPRSKDLIWAVEVGVVSNLAKPLASRQFRV